MVKFAKQLELQLVPEWRGAYCEYKLLKKSLNKIKQNPLDIPHGPGILNSNLRSPLDRGQSRRRSFWSHIDLIEVKHQWPNFLLHMYSMVSLQQLAGCDRVIRIAENYLKCSFKHNLRYLKVPFVVRYTNLRHPFLWPTT